MTKKANLPLIRFKGFTSPWEQRKFDDYFDERNERSGIGELISVTINSGIKKFNELNRFDSKPDDLSKYKVVCKGDIAYNSMRMWQGASGLSPYTGILSPAYTVITPKYNVSSLFFSYQLKRPQMIHLFKINSQGLTKDTWNLKFLPFSQIETWAPKDYNEQTKIGTFFQKLDNLITLHQRKYEKLTNVKKSLLEKMFPSGNENVPKVRFKGFTSTWEQRKLKEIGKTFTGLSGKTSEDFGHGKARFITYMNVFSNPIAKLEGTEPIEIDNTQSKVKYGDVFFTTSSETPEEVGMSSIWLKNEENIYLNSFCFGYRLNENEKINFEYFAHLLRAKQFRKDITLLAQGISRYNISKNKVMEIGIRIPSKEAEQNKIGSLFQQLDNLITLHLRKLEKLKNIKKSLLEKMFV